MPRLASPRLKLLLLAGYALLVALRLPNVWRGRFWAEEGAKFLVNAWLLPWHQALLAPWGGYLNITANIGGLLAWYLVPLSAAPYATTVLALAVQLCPAILLLTGRVPALERPPMLIAALLLVATVPASEEVWLSSIGSQVHLSLCAALILGLETRGGAVGVFRIFLLLLAGLSGPGPWVLAPLFLLRAAIDRSPARLWQALALAATVLVQLLFFYSRFPGRTYAIHPLLFLDMAFDKHVLLPFLGPQLGGYLMRKLIYLPALAGHAPAWPGLAMAAITVAVVAGFAAAALAASLWLVVAAVALIVLSYVGVLNDFVAMFGPASGERYVYAPQVLIGLALLFCAGWAGMINRIAAVLAGWLLVVGIAYYAAPGEPRYRQGPVWRAELAWHRRDPHHDIQSWPKGWIVPLPN